VRMLLEPSEVASSLGKPFCFGELGYQGESAGNRGNELDDGGLLLRQQAWAGLLLGGYGSGMNWWWDSYIDGSHLWGQYRGLARTVARLDWRDPALVPLTPNAVGEKLLVMGWSSPRQALVWPQPRSDTWHAALVEKRPRRGLTGPMMVGLAGFEPGAYDVRWLDMISGDEVRATEATADAEGRLSLLVPAQVIDQVAWVSRKP
jgi:hypothetical protein